MTHGLYDMLSVAKTATQDEIKKAYLKLALKLHPDKNPGDAEAKERFQQLQKVYSVLGNPERRKIYDETGATEDEVLQEANFEDMYEYYRAMYKKVTVDDILEFERSYRGSEEERADVLKFYAECEGDMTLLYSYVMCSDPERDDHRFCEMIERGIQEKEVEKYKRFTKYAEKVKKRPAHPDPLGKSESAGGAGAGKGKGKQGGGGGAGALVPSDLVNAIQRNQKKQMDFYEALEAKYANKAKAKKAQAGKKGKGGEDEFYAEPSEEEFLAAQRRIEEQKRKVDDENVGGGSKKRAKK